MNIPLNIETIIKDWLITNKYDGLFNSDSECGCENADLFSCGEPHPDCEAGYKVNCTKDCNHDGYEQDGWHIQKEKP